MRRIAIVTDWFAPRQGGIESQLGELAARLAGEGRTVRVITGTPGAAAPAAYDVTRLDVLTLPSPPLVVSPMLLARLREELSAGWDVVHAHVSIVSPVGWSAAMVARSLGLPVAITFHSVLRGKAALLRMLSAVSPLGSSRIAWSAVSGAVAAQARWGLGDAAEVAILPNGIALEAWRPARAGMPQSGPITLVAAMRLHRKKRGRQLLRAFADAVASLPLAARLVIVGDGPERAAMERDIARFHLGEGNRSAEIRGWMSPRELQRLYMEAHGFLMASVHESFGIAALEARAAGLPVIARRWGSSEFLDHDRNALLADSDVALAGAIRSFLADASLRARLAAARDDLSRFDWPAVARAHEREYERAIGLASVRPRIAATSA